LNPGLQRLARLLLSQVRLSIRAPSWNTSLCPSPGSSCCPASLLSPAACPWAWS